MTASPPPVSRRDIRPSVRLPSPGIPAIAIALAAVLAGLLLFLTLDARRRALTAPAVANAGTASSSSFPPAPPLRLPPDSRAFASAALHLPSDPVGVPPPPPLPLQPPPPPPPERVFQAVAETPEAVLAPRFDGGAYPEAALVIDLTLGDPGRPTADGQGATAEDDSRVRATLMPGLGHLVAEGVLIQAILETPLDTAAPGRVRAQTTRDVLSFDGTRILIPRGSQVVGEYRSDVGQGQSRALIIWSRLIRPDGVAVRLASPAADARGQSGVPGRAAPSFLARFAASALQTAIGLGSTYAAGRSNGPVVVGLGSAVAPSVSSSPATRSLHVTAGAEVSIFVARDLDFGGAPPWP